MKLPNRLQLKNKTWLRLIELAEEWAREPGCELSSDEILTEIWAGFWRGEFEREKEIVFYFTIDKDAYGWSRETLFNMLKNSLGLKLKRTISGWSTEERSGWSFAETFEKTVNEWSTDEGHQKEYEKLSEWSFEMFKKTLNENSRDSVAFSAYVSPMGIDRTDLLAWCSGKGISPPDFWADVVPKPDEEISTTHILPADATKPPSPDPWTFLPKRDAARENVIGMLQGAKLAIKLRREDCLYKGRLSSEAIAREALDMYGQWSGKCAYEPKLRTLADWIREWVKAGMPDPDTKRA